MADKKTKQKTIRDYPCSIEAEQAVLGAIISDNDVANRIACNIQEDDFYTSIYKKIFAQIKKLINQNKPVDLVMLASSLEREGILQEVGGVTTLDELLDSIPSTANIDYYVNILKKNSTLRKVIMNCRDIIDTAYREDDAEKVLAVAEALIYKISEGNDSSELAHISNATVEVMERIEKAYSDNGSQGGLKVGFKNLDEATNGFMPGQMIVLAARPGCGKTSFAMNMVTNIASRKDSKEVIAVFDLEMSAVELVFRMMSNVAGIDSRDIQNGLENKEGLDKVWLAQDVLKNSNVYIDDSAMITCEQIMSKCRRLKAQKGRLDFVVIDYLQLISPSASTASKSKNEQVGDISRFIKLLAKELKVPVLILSQMSRSIENRDDKQPKLSDLRESGSIEQDADIVAFLTDGEFAVDEGNTPITLMIAKHRNGSIGELYYEWDKSKMRFKPTVANRIIPHAATEQQAIPQENIADTLSGFDVPPDDPGIEGYVDISELG